MQNHYIKCKNTNNQHLENDLESIIYNILSEDYLIYEELLILNVSSEVFKNNGYNKYNKKEISHTFENMINKKLIKELYGSIILKIISTQS